MSYADDNASYCASQNIKEVIDTLKRFKNNSIRANPDKHHLLVNNKDRIYTIKVGNKTITYSKCGKLLGIKIAKELNFGERV